MGVSAWGRDDEPARSGTLAQYLGVSRRLTDHFYLGAEYLFEQQAGEWSSWQPATSALGPTLAVASSLGWIALSATRQINGDDTGQFAIDALVGFPF